MSYDNTMCVVHDSRVVQNNVKWVDGKDLVLFDLMTSLSNAVFCKVRYAKCAASNVL